MRKCIWRPLSIVACTIAAGCLSMHPLYKSELSVKPLPQGHGKPKEFFVAVDVVRKERGKKPRVVSSPQLTVIEGKTASMSIQREGTGFTTTALVTNHNGALTLATTITQMKDGSVIWTETKKTAIEDQ